jgi:tetratricopeptide (TPR) repeat protein
MSTRLVRRVLLIGWDGADWQTINPLLEEGSMPTLQGLLERGVSGRIATLYPIISPILWNSIATGKRADKHGIVGFIEPDPKGDGVRPVSSTSRKAKAIWNILSQSGLRSCVVGWYASHPAEPINGCVLTDRFQTVITLSGKEMALDPHTVHPSDLFEVAASLRVDPRSLTPKQLLPFFPEGWPSDLKDIRFGAVAKVLAESATIHNAATYLVENEDWDLTAVYYDTIDHFCHGWMEFHPPRMAHVTEEDARIYGYIVRGAYQYHDMMLARLLELAGPETTVIIVSDHGFYNNALRPEISVDPFDAADGKPPRRKGVGLNPVTWHRPQGVFVAAGPGVKQDELVHGASLLDVTPTILTLLGLPVADDMDGAPLTQIFHSRVPLEVSRISTYEEPHPDDGVHRNISVEEQDPWAARQALEQLAALGYVELSPTGDKTQDLAAAVEAHQSNLAQVYYSSGRFEEALACLRGILAKAKRKMPQVCCRIALCLLALRRGTEAQSMMQEVVADFPDMPLAKLLLGRIRAARSDVGSALMLFREVQELHPRLPFLHVQIGQIHLRQRRWAEAEAAFRKAIEIDEDCAEAHDGLGVILRQRGEFDDAIYEHMRAASLVHHRAQTHVNLGIALTSAKQIDWAVRAFSVAAELAPEQPFPHRCLAQLYRRVKRDREKAREHTLQAWELRSKLRGRPPAFIAGA